MGSLADLVPRNPVIRSCHDRCFVKKRCAKKFRKIHRKTPVLVSLFNKVAGLQTCDFIKKRLRHWCFSVKIAFFRTPFLKNICELLLLYNLMIWGYTLMIWKILTMQYAKCYFNSIAITMGEVIDKIWITTATTALNVPVLLATVVFKRK